MKAERDGNGLIARLDFYIDMVRSRQFGPAARDVAIVLLYRQMNGRTGRCYPAIATLMEETSLDRRSVQRAIIELKKSGWWQVDGRGRGAGRGHANSYRPILEKSVVYDAFLRPEKASFLSRKGVVSDAPTRKNREEDSPPSPSRGCEGPSAMADFWRAYPSRAPHPNPRKPAQRSFEAALKRGADRAAIVRGAENYSRYVDEHVADRRHVAQAVTWLNQERWKDHQQPPEPVRRHVGLF